MPHDELNCIWADDAAFRDLLIWAISLSDVRVKRSMLSLVFTFGDKNAEHILRDFLLRTDQPDELKRAVEAAMASGKPTLINAVIDPAAGSESGRIGNLNPQSVVKKK